MRTDWTGHVFEARGLVVIAVAGGVILSLLQIFFSVDLYRDAANVYAFMVRSMVEGRVEDAFHPGIPSLNVLLALPFAFIGLRPGQALSVVSCLFYVFAILFVYLLLKEFLSDRKAAAGCLLFAFAPKIIRFSCCALIDSGKIFFLVAALFFLHRLLKNRFRTWGAALGFGAAGDELYAIDEEHNTLVSMLGSLGDPEAEDSIEWYAVFGLFGTDYTGKKYLSRFNIRMQIAEGAEARLEIQYNQNGTWEDMGKIKGQGTRSFMLPVIPRRCDHLQVKISGRGRCRIYSVSRVLEVSTDA